MLAVRKQQHPAVTNWVDKACLKYKLVTGVNTSLGAVTKKKVEISKEKQKIIFKRDIDRYLQCSKKSFHNWHRYGKEGKKQDRKKAEAINKMK